MGPRIIIYTLARRTLTVRPRTMINMKSKALAVAVCLVMALSCVTVAAVDSSPESDASAIDLKVGDAWGAGMHIDDAKAVEYVNQIYKKLTGLESEYSDLKAFLNDMLKLAGMEGKIDELNVSLDFWTMAEITQKTDDGYTISIDGVVELSFLFSGTITIPDGIDLGDDDGADAEDDADDTEDDADDEPEESKVLTAQGLKMCFYATFNSTICTDKDFAMTSMDASLDVKASIEGKANLAIMDGDLEFVEAAKDIKESLAVEYEVEIYFYDPIHILPYEGHEKGWTDETKARLTMSAALNSSFKLGDTNDTQAKETSIEDITWEVKVKESDGTYTMTPVIDNDDFEDFMNNLNGIPGLDKGIFYTYPFENNSLIPKELLVGGSLKLDDASKKTVSDAIDGIKKKYSNSDRTFEVKFLDVDDNVLQTKEIKYGSFVDLSSEYDNKILETSDGKMKFVGWANNEGIIWSENYPVKTNLVLKPVFAKIVEKTPVDSDFKGTTDVIWSVIYNDNALANTISNGLIYGDRSLYISITDEDGKVLYQWNISGGYGAEKGTIVPKVSSSVTPNKTYLQSVAGGNPTIYLDFNAHGEMPSNTTFKYYVGDTFSDGTTVVFYHDNTERGTAEYSGKDIVKNGYVEMDLIHCSAYMLVGESVSSEESSSITMMVVGVIVVIALLAVAMFVINGKKNKTA